MRLDTLPPGYKENPADPSRPLRMTAAERETPTNALMAVARGDKPTRGSKIEARFADMVAHIPGCEREYRFDPSRRWRIDFAWPSHKLAVEIEGGTWVNGGHSRGAIYSQNCEKYNALSVQGWRLLRFTTDMLRDSVGCVNIVELALANEVTR